MDNLIICDRCGSDACYTEEVSHEVTAYLCYGCGFQTNSLMKKDEPFLEEQISILPELYKDLLYTDDGGKIWMPSMINQPTKGMIFANGPSSNEWNWAAVKAIPVPEDEKTKYPIPGKKNQYYKFKMDMTTLKSYPEKEFMDALSYVGLLPE